MNTIEVSWTEFKVAVDARGVSIQYVEYNNNYNLILIEKKKELLDKEMNWDITWCMGARCGVKSRCKLYIGRLRDYFEKNNINPEGERISVAQFDDGLGNCDLYDEVDSLVSTINYNL